MSTILAATAGAASATANIEAMLAQHYAPGELLRVIKQALAALGKNLDSASLDDLAPMDEFHVGGREATEALLAPLAISATQRLLDIGCGVGGAARYVANSFGCAVNGFDLTTEFVEVGQQLNHHLGLADRVALHQGNVLALPLADNSADGAYMLHVGMNIADKPALFNEVARVLRPGGFFAIYDLMRIADGELSFPVPWSATAASSFVEPPDTYESALREAGFAIRNIRNRHDYALDFYARMKQQMSDGKPQPMGLHLLMGEATAIRLENAYQAVLAGVIAPVEIVVELV